jgi:hypothetical protein
VLGDELAGYWSVGVGCAMQGYPAMEGLIELSAASGDVYQLVDNSK